MLKQGPVAIVIGMTLHLGQKSNKQILVPLVIVFWVFLLFFLNLNINVYGCILSSQKSH